MDEYIEREAVYEDFEKCNSENPKWTPGRVKALIARQKTADVAPVRHGRWIFGKDLPYSWGQIPKNKYHLYCSECLEQAFNRSEDNDPDFDVDTSYCTNCGAKMDGGDGSSAMA